MLKDEIIKELLKYSPNISDDEIKTVREFAQAQGSYFELLLKDDCSFLLKKMLLESFWQKYDAKHNSNLTEAIIKNIEKEYQEQLKEKEHQEKIDYILSLDWNFEVN